MVAYPALALNAPTFDPAGNLLRHQQILGMQSQIQSAESQNRLRELQLASQTEQHNALLNARAAQRVLMHPEGSQTRADAYRAELDEALRTGRINPGVHSRWIAQPPTDFVLNGIIEQFTPLTGGLNPRQIMSLFGFNASGEDQRTPPSGAGGVDVAALDDLHRWFQEGRDENRRDLPDTGGGIGAADALNALRGLRAPTTTVSPPPDNSGRERTLQYFDPLGLASGTIGTLRTRYPNLMGQDRSPMSMSRYIQLPPWLAGFLNATPMGLPNALSNVRRGFERLDEAERAAAERAMTAPSGAPGGLTLPIDPARLAALTRGQVADRTGDLGGSGINAPGGAADLINANLSGAERATPGTAGTTGASGLAGLRGAIAGMSREQRLAAMLYMLKGDYGEMAKLILGQTAGTEAVDRAFAPEFANWTAAGGYADIQRQLAQLAGVERNLASGASLTGGITGSLPDWVNRFINPAAISNRQRVEEVVQRSLRQILGAQFTEQEATRLIARAYDPTLPQSENLRRVRLLLQQIAAGAEARQGAANYFQRFGTLRGWQGRMPNLADFNALFDENTTTSGTTGAGNYTWTPEGGLQPAR